MSSIELTSIISGAVLLVGAIVYNLWKGRTPKTIPTVSTETTESAWAKSVRPILLNALSVGEPDTNFLTMCYLAIVDAFSEETQKVMRPQFGDFILKPKVLPAPVSAAPSLDKSEVEKAFSTILRAMGATCDTPVHSEAKP